MGPAVLQPLLPRARGGGRTRYGSRSTAVLVALAFNCALVYLFTRWTALFPVPQQQGVEPMLARLIDEPRGGRRQSDLPAINPRLSEPTIRLADTPPKIRIETPIEAPPLPTPSEMPAALPSGRKDVPAEGSPRGIMGEPGEGAGTAILHQVPPVYSAAAAMAHEHGVVTLRVLVDEQGKPTLVRLRQSSGFPRLDQSAIDAVRQYQFTPADKRTSATQNWTTVKLEFDLLPMPVPTAIIGFDTTIAEQISAAKRADFGFHRDSPQADEMVRRFAGNLLDTLSRSRVAESAPDQVRSSPTPIQLLAKRGSLQSVQFVGVARRGFDCGTASLRGHFASSRCEIFAVRQVGGTSYLLAGLEEGGKVLKSVAIMAASEPPRDEGAAR
jgi:periplasmic protein TonB